MMSIESLPPLRDIIAEHGLSADKRFGQNYLLDINLTRKIARLCELTDSSIIFEVGPGPGGLTRALLLEGAHKVIAIEKDARFIDALQSLKQASDERLDLVNADALRINETEMISPGSEAIVSSNLPYNIGTALLIKWLEADPIWWKRLVLMFQREVANRITADVGQSDYGRLSILTAARSQARMGLTVPARAFTPPPKVDSAVVVIDPLPVVDRFEDIEALGIITASAFGQRRKTLRKSLASAASQTSATSEEILEQAGLDPSARAETIAPAGFFELARCWRAVRN